MAAEPEQPARPKSGPVPLALALAACLPGAYLGLAELFHLGHPELAPLLLALTYGVAVIGAAFVLAWAAEAAQLDVSASLAIGVLALIAVLPEYAVGFVFAWKGGNDVEQYGSSCKAPDADGRLQLRPGPGQHDRGEPAADRHRLVDDRVHRLLAVAAARRAPPRGRHHGALQGGGAGLPLAGLRLLPDPAPEADHDPDRHGHPGQHLHRLHPADLQGPPDRARPDRPGGLDRGDEQDGPGGSACCRCSPSPAS